MLKEVGITRLARPPGRVMISLMASLDFFITKYGAVRGRAKYNSYHQKYRKLNRKKLAAYQRERRALQKASIDGLSQPI
jgi:hypothetical protein